jgi:hypothetical protein
LALPVYAKPRRGETCGGAWSGFARVWILAAHPALNRHGEWVPVDFRPISSDPFHGRMAAALRQPANSQDAEGAVTTRNYDDWTIDRWKVDAKFPSVELDESSVDLAPPLWKDLTLASVVALALWVVAALILR